MTRGTGALPSDPRANHGEPLDLLVAAARAVPASSASLRQFVDRIPDQGEESSCVGHAIAQCMRVRSRVQGAPVDPSAKAIYALAREYDAPRSSRLADRGCQPEKAFLAASELGLVARARWEDDADVRRPVPVDVLLAGSIAHVTGEYAVGLDRRGEIEKAITAGFPVFWVRRVDRAYQRWFGDEVYPGLLGEPLGLHAGCLVEFDDRGPLDAGSYGRGLGRDGFVRYAWSFFESDDVALVKVVTIAPLEVA